MQQTLPRSLRKEQMQDQMVSATNGESLPMAFYKANWDIVVSKQAMSKERLPKKFFKVKARKIIKRLRLRQQCFDFLGCLYILFW
jgi:hypothetical protein